MAASLKPLFTPRSIAILGASTDFQKLNGRTLKALLDQGYPGAIYPVNPKYREIAGLTCHADVAAVPGPIDLAIVAVPARHVPASIRELGARGVRGAVVFSSGFSEMGEAGRALEQELRKAIDDTGMRVLGPNCLGMINAFDRVLATFTQYSLGAVESGPIGFVTQSGALGTATAGMARRRGLHFGYFINTGNELDIRFVEAMGELLDDARIRVGAGYIEGLKDGPGLHALGERALENGKPLAIVKVGSTGAGARAIASHTGSLAGEDAVFDGVLRQVGILRARSDEHLLDLIEVMVNCPLPAGRGVGIVTRSGGAGALMADRAEASGLEVTVLADATRERLRKVVPQFGSLANPIDITAQGLVDPGIMRESIKIVLSDPNVHAAVVWLAFTEKYADVTVDTFIQAKEATDKPFVVAWVGIPEDAAARMRAAGIPLLRGAEPAVDALAALVRHADAKRAWLSDRAARAALPAPTLELPVARGQVSSMDAVGLLRACGVPLAECLLARSAEEAVAAAERLGYPVALKIESADIAHKTEVGGVRLGLRDAAMIRQAYVEVTAAAGHRAPTARIDSVLVQRMAEPGVELVVGLQNDSVFGPVVMVGLGGILIEVLKDVAFRKAPVTPAEAGRMLDELRGRAILDGVRGAPAVDCDALCRLVSAVSVLGAMVGPRLRELDLNPVIAGPNGCVAADWLLVLD